MAKTWNTRCKPPYFIILDGVAQGHDVDVFVAISSFPHIGVGINGDPTIVHFGEFSRFDDIRGWKGGTVDTDSLQFFQTLLSNTIVCRDNIEGL